MSDINSALGVKSNADDQTLQTGWFDGRARRSEYWTRWIWTFLVSMVLGLPLILIPICTAVRSHDGSYAGGALLSIILGVLLTLFCLLAMWPITVRRLHDRGMSGWWILWFGLLGCIPFVGWIAGIVQFVIVGCMDGIPGPNQYGPDPKGRNPVQTTNNPIVGIVNNNANVNTTATPNAEERLVKLSALKDKGLISDAEYESKRSQILKEL